jgi:hypothetical protein
VTVTDLDGEAIVGPLTLPSGRPGVLTYPNADPGQQSASRSGPSGRGLEPDSCSAGRGRMCMQQLSARYQSHLFVSR